MLNPQTILKNSFGFDSFRDGQLEAIQAVQAGDDCLFITPTGGGKSIVYQIPALLHDGLTIVISPLISLMKDQVDGLKEKGFPAELYNSTLSDANKRDVINAVNDGRVKLLYMAPEGLSNTFNRNLLTKVSLLAIDESHCISQWGHDFRPKYLAIASFRKMIGNPTCIAVTATATEVVRNDIVKQLNMRNPHVLVRGFDRPNLNIIIRYPRHVIDKHNLLVDFLRRVPGPCIVYCGRRNEVEGLARSLTDELGEDVFPYHAGLTDKSREDSQNAFMNDDVRIITATNAFGMGIDKPDIRGIVHFQMPGSLEAYYQEIGRAGRDGQQSYVLMLYSPGDRSLHDFFVRNSWPDNFTIENIFDVTMERLEAAEENKLIISQEAFAASINHSISGGMVGSVWKMMEKGGAVTCYKPNDICELALLETDEYPNEVEVKILERLLQEQHYNQKFELSTVKLAKFLGMDRNRLVAILKKMDHRFVEYKPPSRTGGVKLLRDKKVEDTINFEYVDYHRDLALRMIKNIVDFIENRSCRRAQILKYFGDTSKPANWRCGTCDVCRESR